MSFKLSYIFVLLLVVMMGCQRQSSLSDDILEFSPNVLEFDRGLILVTVPPGASSTTSFELRLSGPNLDRLSEPVTAVIEVNEELSNAVLGKNFTFSDADFVDITTNSRRFILTPDRNYVHPVNLTILARANESEPYKLELTLQIKQIVCEEFDCLVSASKSQIRLIWNYQ